MNFQSAFAASCLSIFLLSSPAQAAQTIVTFEDVATSATNSPLYATGDVADGYDAVLIRHGVGNAECPITYDLVAVGKDKTYAVIPDINKCSRILNVNVDGERLMLVTEKQNGRTEIIEYNDKQRRHGDAKP